MRRRITTAARTRVARLLVAAMVAVVVLSSLGPIAPASAQGTASPARANGLGGVGSGSTADLHGTASTYAVGQDGQCVVEMDPIGDGSRSGPEYYGYADFSSQGGTTQFQETFESQFFVYEGSDGTNLVILHDEWGDHWGGGSVTFDVTGLPEDGEWTVEDDDYGAIGYNDSNQDDVFVHDGTSSELNWMYGYNTTDGGVFRGLGESGWSEITIDPAFKNESYAAQEREPPWLLADNGPNEWMARSAGNETAPLNMTEPVSIRPGGCAATSPTAALSAPTNVTAGSTVTLDATSPDSPTTPIQYEWDVDGDGTVEATTDGPTLDHQYNATGTVTPSVTVTDRFGNTDTATATITVETTGPTNAAPSVNLTADPTTLTVGESVDLTADAADPDGDDLSYAWTQVAGDESLSLPSGSDGTVTPSTADTFRVRVTVEDPDGANASDTATFTVEEAEQNRAPTAAFDWTPSSPSVGQNVTLDAANSSDPDGAIASYEWDLDGDGTYEAAGSRTTHSFADAGQHGVTLRVTDDAGTHDTVTETVSVTSEGGNAAPSVTLSADPTSVSVNGSVALTADATDQDGDDLTYTWTSVSGPASLDLPTGSNGTVTPSAAGNYEVAVTVEDPAGANDTASVSFGATAENAPPTAAFDWEPSSPAAGTAVTFDASNATDDDGSIASYEWDFDGDGTTDASGTTAEYAFASAGDHDVTLVVTDDAGINASVTRTVPVAEATNAGPTVSLSADPAAVTAGDDVTLTADATDPDDDELTYSWETVSGPANLTLPGGATGTVTPSTAGTYEVQVTVADPDGANATASATIEVTEANEPPVAAFSWSPTDPVTGENVTLDATSSADPDGSIASYEWDLDGDGNFEVAGTQPRHAFDAPGPHDVTLRVADDAGSTDDTTMTVAVNGTNQPPSVELEADPRSAVAGDSVDLSATANDPDGEELTYTWEQRDGPASLDLPSGDGGTVAPVEPGSYEVAVTVEDPNGSVDSATATFTVEAAERNHAPEATLSASATDPAIGESITLDASGSSDPDGDELAYAWTFVSVPDGATTPSLDGATNAGVAFDTPGNYEVRLTVEDPDGATDSATKTLSVAGEPDEPNLHVHDVRVVDDTVEVDGETRIEVTVHNDGSATGEKTLKLRLDGDVVDGATVSVAPGEEETVEIIHCFKRPGEYTLTVAGESVDVSVHAPTYALEAASVGGGDSVTLQADEPGTVTAEAELSIETDVIERTELATALEELDAEAVTATVGGTDAPVTGVDADELRREDSTWVVPLSVDVDAPAREPGSYDLRVDVDLPSQCWPNGEAECTVPTALSTTLGDGLVYEAASSDDSDSSGGGSSSDDGGSSSSDDDSGSSGGGASSSDGGASSSDGGGSSSIGGSDDSSTSSDDAESEGTGSTTVANPDARQVTDGTTPETSDGQSTTATSTNAGEPTSTTTTGSAVTESTGQPGFGVAVAVLALLAAALLARARG